MMLERPIITIAACAGVSLSLGVLLTPAMRSIAGRLGFIDRPNPRKPQGRGLPLLGGLALYLAAVGAYLLFVPLDLRSIWLIGGGGGLLFLGLIDDRLAISARLRLMLQTAGALGVVAAGIRFQWFPWEPANYLISIIWLLGVTNAINCLDCADGIAAGVGAVAAAALCVIAAVYSHWAVATMAAALAGACLGFLRYNYPPASIFLGDAGSTVLGFLLGALAMAAARGAPPFTQAWVAALPLAVPVWDIIVVHLRRHRAGLRKLRALLESNGRDHLPHRLFARGLTARESAFAVYLMAAAFAGAGVVVAIDGIGALLVAMELTLLALVTGEAPFGVLVSGVSRAWRRWRGEAGSPLGPMPESPARRSAPSAGG